MSQKERGAKSKGLVHTKDLKYWPVENSSKAKRDTPGMQTGGNGEDGRERHGSGEGKVYNTQRSA